MKTTAHAMGFPTLDPERTVTRLPDQPALRPRLWPALALLLIFWTAHFVVGAIDKPYFVGFIYGMAAPALLLLLFSVWWWTNRRIAFSDRIYGCLAVVIMGIAAAPLCHRSVWFGLATEGLPRALTVLTLWTLIVSWTGLAWYRLGLLAVLALSWGWFALIRIDGLNSDLKATTSWRWVATEEEEFLASHAGTTQTSDDDLDLPPLQLSAGDWPGFRGADRDGVIRGVTLSADWESAPPRPLWRKRLGPAWSSMIVIGDRLYTQEQRGKEETVVCYEASTGQQLWAHGDVSRFEETVSRAGPRATPTFADGRIYTLGANGILNCLGPRGGKCYWSHDITVDAPAKVPQWGFSGSPLVVDGKVIVFAGGNTERNLLAYDARTGELAWTAPAGAGSYASPQLITIAGQRHCLFLSENGLTAVDPASGHPLWQFGAAMPGAPRTHQVHRVGESHLFVPTLSGVGASRINVQRQGDQWQVSEVWASSKVKPEFPDFVVHDGYAYGFDGPVFCCVDLAKGSRRWKDGRYGRGQALLLADASQLLVTSEDGELILLAADPEKNRELGRLQALKGTTWNHPVIAHGRLYVRNAVEMASYDISGR